MAQRGLFYSGIVIQRVARVPDGAGGHTEGYATIASNASGRISPISPMALFEEERGMLTKGVVPIRFATSSDTDVKKNDRLVHRGVNFEVKSVGTTSTGRRKECLCEEVNIGS